MSWDNTENRKPTILERIQMDLQHDMWNSKIKYSLTLGGAILLSIAAWWYRLSS